MGVQAIEHPGLGDDVSRVDVRERLLALEERWRPYGGRGGMRVRPGLTDAEMDAVVAPIGYRLDEEQRAWWGWADGTEGTATNDADAGQVFPATCLLPLRAAVREYRRWSAQNSHHPELWPLHWLPLTNGQIPLVSGATGTDRTEVSIFDPEDPPGQILQSLAHQLDVWLWFWDQTDIRPVEEPPGWAGTWPDTHPVLIGALSSRGVGSTRRPLLTPRKVERPNA